jgi:hypothetical protein
VRISSKLAELASELAVGEGVDRNTYLSDVLEWAAGSLVETMPIAAVLSACASDRESVSIEVDPELAKRINDSVEKSGLARSTWVGLALACWIF